MTNAVASPPSIVPREPFFLHMVTGKLYSGKQPVNSGKQPVTRGVTSPRKAEPPITKTAGGISINVEWIIQSQCPTQCLLSPLCTRDLLHDLTQELAFSCIWKEAQATNRRRSEHQIFLEFSSIKSLWQQYCSSTISNV